MKKITGKYYWLLAAVIVIPILAACNAAPAAVKPTVSSIKAGAPRILDIVGIHEWKPLQQSKLICALDTDDDGTLNYSWSSDSGTIDGQGKEVTWTAPSDQGSYRVTVAVSNNKGEGTTFSKTFKVTTNPYNNDTPDSTIYLNLSLPSTTTLTAAAHPKVFTISEIQCVVAGVDASTLTYKWTAPTGKLMGNGIAEGTASRVGWMSPGIAGDYKVSVVVTDKQGNSAGGEVNFNVYCCRP